jgi:arylsulfatase A-like enzyme
LKSKSVPVFNEIDILMKYILFILIAFLLYSCSTGTKENTAESRPNIIFIMTDDHACKAISAYSADLISTPNIDKLAEQGMRFDRAYVTNSICSPSRAVVLTGKHSHLNSVTDNLDIFDSTQVTYPKILRQHGYETAVVGKWHLKSQPTGFDYWKVLPDQGDYYQPKFRTPEGIVTEQGYVTDIITDLAINFLDSIRDPSKPFMLMYHHKAPHRGWWPAMDDIESFTHMVFPEPSSLFDDYENRGTAAKEAEMRISEHMGYTNDNKIPPEVAEEMGYSDFYGWYKNNYNYNYGLFTEAEKARWDEVYGEVTKEFRKKKPQGRELIQWKYQRYMQDYLATIKRVDDNIGRLMKYLDENGLAENTLVIYTSDQGFYLGEHGWFDKRFMYEESFRTPLIMRWPGKIKVGSVNNDLVQNLDYAPTMLAAAGAPVPGDMQGKKLQPLLDGNTEEWRDALYYHYYEYPGIHMVKRHNGIKTERYKLIHFYHDVDEWEMYDLETDPQEMRNIYGLPEYAAVQIDMHERLTELQKEYNDSPELAQQMLEEDLNRK